MTPHPTRRLGRALSVALLALLAALPWPATPAQPAVAASGDDCVRGLQLLPVPDEVLVGVLHDALAVDGRPGWAVGGSSDGLTALRWVDGRWKAVDMGRRSLSGLSGAALLRDRLLAVGYARPRPWTLTPIAGRVTRSGWASSDLPTGHGRATLADIDTSPTGRAWAVGVRHLGGRYRAMILRWTSGGWRRDDRGALGRGTGLTAVASSGGGRAWAVGWKLQSGGRLSPLILERRDGWRTVPGASLPRGSAVLTDVWADGPDDGWTVGYVVRRGTSSPRPVLERWKRSRWRRQSLPWDRVGAIPLSVASGPDGRLWIAGVQIATDARQARGFVVSRAGGRWTVSVVSHPARRRSQLRAVAALDGGALAVGAADFTALALRTCDGEGVPRGAVTRPVVGRTARRGWHDVRDAAEGLPAAVDRGPATALPRPTRPRGFRVADVADSAGLAEVTATWRGFVHDFDRDGWLDVFYSRHERPPRLAYGGRSGFRDATRRAFAHTDRHGCGVADVDGDGVSDVLCAIGRARGWDVTNHELTLRPGRRDAAPAWGGRGLVDPLGRGRLVAFLRLDADRRPEVLVVNQPDRVDALPSPNRFFRNVDGRLVPAPGVGLDQAVGGACLQTVDLDDDGDDDLLHCQAYPLDGRHAGLRVFRNESGRLHERSRALGVRPIGDVDAVLADVTGDDRADLIQLSARRLRVSRATAGGFRLLYQARVGSAVAVAAGDVDGDGLADIYVARSGRTGNAPDRLLVAAHHGRRYLSVRIPQTRIGSADDVVAIDHDRNGLTDFLVLNGRGRPGPVQLLASYPTP